MCVNYEEMKEGLIHYRFAILISVNIFVSNDIYIINFVFIFLSITIS